MRKLFQTYYAKSHMIKSQKLDLIVLWQLCNFIDENPHLDIDKLLSDSNLEDLKKIHVEGDMLKLKRLMILEHGVKKTINNINIVNSALIRSNEKIKEKEKWKLSLRYCLKGVDHKSDINGLVMLIPVFFGIDGLGSSNLLDIEDPTYARESLANILSEKQIHLEDVLKYYRSLIFDIGPNLLNFYPISGVNSALKSGIGSLRNKIQICNKYNSEFQKFKAARNEDAPIYTFIPASIISLILLNYLSLHIFLAFLLFPTLTGVIYVVFFEKVEDILSNKYREEMDKLKQIFLNEEF